jgi:hypothetical protein
VNDPSLKVLLRESAQGDRDHRSPFFTALLSLARRHGARPADYVPGRFVDEGFAAPVGGGHVVAILRGIDPFIPGRDTQVLLLLDHEGRLLDRLACGINNRLTRMYVPAGTFRTDVPAAPEADGAQLVVRYVPEPGGSVSGNWSHEITQGGRTNRFPWDQGRPGALPSAEWGGKGLCRVAVRDGKFVVLFPPLSGD